jgi:hypothetical protein
MTLFPATSIILDRFYLALSEKNAAGVSGGQKVAGSNPVGPTFFVHGRIIAIRAADIPRPARLPRVPAG